MVRRPTVEPRIPLGLYVTIGTALQAGIPRASVLVAAGLTDDEWTVESEAWSRRLASALIDDDAVDSTALAEHDAAVIDARNRLARSVEPLDGDFAAWFGFQAASLRAADPEEFVQERGLTPLDMMRIGAAWTVRLAADAELRMAALQTMERTDLSVPDVRVGPWPLDTAFDGLRQAAAPPAQAAASSESTAPPVDEAEAPLWTALPGKAPVTP
jgi:hypothetical protein